MPMKDIEVVLVKQGQQVKNGFDREELSACIQHEASMRIEVGGHDLPP
jgi:hypothetical protein